MSLSSRKTYGNDCIASSLVRAIDKCRYKDGGGGDPKAFKSALAEAGLPKGILPRYRENRLHILFHLSGKLVGNHKFFCAFFKSCGFNKLTEAISHDLEIALALLELKVLGLTGKLLCGPWMKKLYTNDNDISHIKGIRIVKDENKKVAYCVDFVTVHHCTKFRSNICYVGDFMKGAPVLGSKMPGIDMVNMHGHTVCDASCDQ